MRKRQRRRNCFCRAGSKHLEVARILPSILIRLIGKSISGNIFEEGLPESNVADFGTKIGNQLR